jgi:HAD superfamily hydrolase (TIGR01549 family)
MKNHALIFDCDGTLMDSLEAAVESYHYALQQMGEKPRTTAEIKAHFGLAADRVLLHLLGDGTRAREAYIYYKEYQKQVAPRTQVFPGIRELLDQAHAAEVPLGIVTGRHREDLNILLEPHALLDDFQVIVTDDELGSPKPDPEGLLRAAFQLGIPPPQVCYVGDSPSDIRAARGAGTMAVAALWNPDVDRSLMAETEPDVLAERPDEVWRAFRRFTRRT